MATDLSPSSILDLHNWKLTLPIDKSGGTDGDAAEVKQLSGYQDSFFHVDDGGEVVFTAPVDGATTSGSHYARTELREMNGTSLAAWTVAQGGTMVATLEVNEVPFKDDGSTGRIVIGQIHGQDEELARLYYDHGTVYVVSDHAGPANGETTFQLVDAAGAAPDVSLDETFSYLLRTEGHTLTVGVLADGHVYGASIPISSTWDSDRLYFKAGIYLGVGEDGSGAGQEGTGEGQVSFHALQVEHGTTDLALPSADEGATTPPGTPPVDTSPVDTPPVETPPAQPTPAEPDKPLSLMGTSAGETLTGAGGNDEIKGQKGDDFLIGGAGNDTLWGNAGKDTLVGGAGDDWLKGGDGQDIYVFGAGHGHDTVDEFRSEDTLQFADGLFASPAQAKAALESTSKGVVLHTGPDTSILFSHASLDEIMHAHWVV